MATRAQSIPFPALVLGISGLIPFVVSAILLAFPQWSSSLIVAFLPLSSTPENPVNAQTLSALDQLAVFSLGAYAAVILSFLGGVRWGNLLNDKTRLKQWSPLTLSVVPSLIAWPALLLPPFWMLSLLAIGLVLQYTLDVEALRRKELPAWFGKLRLILTTGAILSLLVGIVSLKLR